MTEVYGRWRQDRLGIVALVVAGLLFLAIAEMPYGYYQFMRIAIVVAGLYVAYQSHREDNFLWLIFAAAAVILFNPIMPIEMEEEEWRPFDAVFGIGFLALGLWRTAPLLRRSLYVKGVGGAAVAFAGLVFLNQAGPTLFAPVEDPANEMMTELNATDSMMDGTANDIAAFEAAAPLPLQRKIPLGSKLLLMPSSGASPQQKSLK